jgi:hypothetical protein
MHGYTVAFAVACGLFIAGAAVTAVLLRSDHPDRQTPPPADVDALQQRIVELEEHNRLLRQALYARDVAVRR